MTEQEAYQEHIRHTHNAYCRIVIRHASFDAARMPGGEKFAMGCTDSMPYHTGTTAATRQTYGGTQYRYMEGLWDDVYDRLTGCYNGSGGMFITLNPASFTENSGGTAVGAPVAGYTSGWSIVSAAGFPMLISSEGSGDGTNYVGDYCNFRAAFPVICVGGSMIQGKSHGMFYIYFDYFMFLQNLCRIAATCALVVPFFGDRVLSLVP